MRNVTNVFTRGSEKSRGLFAGAEEKRRMTFHKRGKTVGMKIPDIR